MLSTIKSGLKEAGPRVNKRDSHLVGDGYLPVITHQLYSLSEIALAIFLGGNIDFFKAQFFQAGTDSSR